MMMEIIAILFLAMWIPLAFIQWSKRPLADSFETERTLGSVCDASVAIAFDGRRRYVELVLDEDIWVHAYLTSSEALLVAQWLRTAATPGRTLGDARGRSKGVPA